MEPYEEAVVEVPEQYVGSVVELFAQRKGEMQDMQPSIEVRVLVCNRMYASSVCDG
jgi:predicted membrane GTPase involved in stress response